MLFGPGACSKFVNFFGKGRQVPQIMHPINFIAGFLHISVPLVNISCLLQLKKNYWRSGPPTRVVYPPPSMVDPGPGIGCNLIFAGILPYPGKYICKSVFSNSLFRDFSNEILLWYILELSLCVFTVYF